MLKILFFALIIGTISCYESYRNFKVYEVTPNAQQYEAFARWEHEAGVDFWRLYTAEKKSTVMIAPDRQEEFERFLVGSNIEHTVIINDFEVNLENEREQMARSRRTKQGFNGRSADFSVYWSFQEMDDYCRFLAQQFPQFVTYENMMDSPEGRPIIAMRVSSGTFGQKPIIAMEAMMHAREWVTSPTALYLLHHLVEVPASRNELLANVDWLIIPVQNPDGYEFSRSDNRMWRQNRRVQSPTCIGADLNRNFEFAWRSATAGQVCGSLTYPGPFPLSEPEDFVLDRVTQRYNTNIRIYISVHSFGDLWLYPWGYADGNFPVHNHPEHVRVGNIWRDAILAATGKDYLVVNSLTFFGNINGAVDDHMVGQVRTHTAFTLELTNGFGFLYPEERIFALCQETFVGYRALALDLSRQVQMGLI